MPTSYSRVPLDIPPGLNSDDTTFSEALAWWDGCNVRFRLGKPQVIGGWERFTDTLLSGVCRSVLAWTDNNQATLNVAFGTHAGLQINVGGEMADITPLGPATQLPANPLTVTNASTTVSVNFPNHGLTAGKQIILSGALAVGRISLAGTYTVGVTDANTLTITAGSAATVTKTLAANPITTYAGSPIVQFNEPGHNIAGGTNITISGAAAVGGITPNGTFPVTVIDANNYQITFTSNATSAVTGGGGSAVAVAVPTAGGGSVVIAVPQVPLPGGQVDGTGSDGFGTGGYSGGPYGQPGTADWFPRTWSLQPWGQTLLASPRNGGLYKWSNNVATPAVSVPTAPAQITQVLATPQRFVFALGCTQEDGTWNPLCLRHSNVGHETGWSTDATSSSTSRQYILPGGGRIVGGLVVDKYVLVWTTKKLFLGTYVGQLTQVWRFDEVGDRCGLVGPNAAAALGGTAYWWTPDLQCRSYSPGGSVATIPCKIRADFFENLAAAQADKIIASTVAAMNEIRWDYPDARDGDPGTENSRWIALSIEPGTLGPWNGPDYMAWSRGRPLNGVTSARTARFDAGPAEYPLGVTADGHVYFEEVGHSGDGGALPWLLESSDFYLDPNIAVLVSQLWPDFGEDQKGLIDFTFYTRLMLEISASYPETAWGPFTIAPGQGVVDFKASGRFGRLLIQGGIQPGDSYMRSGKPVFWVKPRGRKG